MDKLKFVKLYLADARKCQSLTGIDAVAQLAQCAVETGWGDKIVNNNMFGIKWSKGNTCDRKLVKTHETLNSPNYKTFPVIHSVTKLPNGKYSYFVEDWFRAYASPTDSFADHCNFFIQNPRYAKALSVKADGVKFLHEVTAAGYATGEGYENLLVSVYKSIQKVIVDNKL